MKPDSAAVLRGRGPAGAGEREPGPGRMAGDEGDRAAGGRGTRTANREQRHSQGVSGKTADGVGEETGEETGRGRRQQARRSWRDGEQAYTVLGGDSERESASEEALAEMERATGLMGERVGGWVGSEWITADGIP